MIREDAGNLACELAALVTVKQVHQAVVVFRNQDRHARAVIRLRKPPLHFEAGCDRRERTGEIVERNIELGGIELNPHQEYAGVHVAVLVRVQDIPAVLVNESSNAGDYAFLVGATEQQDGGFLRHLRAFKSFRISRAAFAPEPPVSPVPGWVPDPHR